MSELRTVAAELANRSTRHELNQSVNNHVKPLVGTVMKVMRMMVMIMRIMVMIMMKMMTISDGDDNGND